MKSGAGTGLNLLAEEYALGHADGALSVLKSGNRKGVDTPRMV